MLRTGSVASMKRLKMTHAPQGYVVASASSPAALQALAVAAPGGSLLCDGTNDEVQLHAAWARAAAASGSMRTVSIAPGTYTTDWTLAPSHWWGPGNHYYSLRPTITPTRVITRALVRQKVTIRTVLRPTNFNNNISGGQGGYSNRYIWMPGGYSGEGTSGSIPGGTDGSLNNHWFDGIIFDGRAGEMATAEFGSAWYPSSGKWSMDGLREHGASNFLATHCIFQNFRGTGTAGQLETTALYLINGTARYCIARQTDGGNAATGFHHALDEGATTEHCEAHGANRMNHGFAQYKAVDAVRKFCYASGMRSSGIRCEVSENPLDEDHTIIDCADGFVTQCCQDHTARRVTISEATEWAIAVLKSQNFDFEDFTVEDRQSGYDLFLYAVGNSTCPDAGIGIAMENEVKATGTFTNLDYDDSSRAMNPAAHVDWSEYGL